MQINILSKGQRFDAMLSKYNLIKCSTFQDTVQTRVLKTKYLSRLSKFFRPKMEKSGGPKKQRRPKQAKMEKEKCLGRKLKIAKAQSRI